MKPFDGVVFCLDDGHPVIGLSLRHPRLDIFWFTLMHELAHIVLHKELLTEPRHHFLNGGAACFSGVGLRCYRR
ncbi:ImmA/IrrE family metallo-endopeptidase [Ralstonia nicotianae]